MSNKFDTAELNDIRKLLGEDVPDPKSQVKAEAAAAPQVQESRNTSGGRTFNLDDILAEVSGVVDEANAEHAAHATTPPQFAPKQQAARPAAQNSAPRTASGMQQQEIRVQRKSAQQAAQPAQAEQEGEPVRAQQRPAAQQQMPRQAARMRDEGEDDVELIEPSKAMVLNNRRSKNLGRRAIPVLILGLISLYLTMAESLALPMPSLISFASNPRLFMLVQVGFEIIAMLIGIDVVGSGFYNLVTGKADRASLVAIANMATILHCMSFIIGGWAGVLPYSSICILLLYLSLIHI